MIVEARAVRRPDDVGFDAFGNLVWTVQDETTASRRRQEA